MTTAWIGDDTYQRQLGYKDASFMLSVPMWARYMYAVVGDQPLQEIPWDRPQGVQGNDRGGPLKAGFPPPPQPGFDLDGKPIALPTTIRGQPVKTGAPPPNLVRQKEVRVPQLPPPGPPGAPLPPGVKPMAAPMTIKPTPPGMKASPTIKPMPPLRTTPTPTAIKPKP
jgi:hypothetical protein